MVAKDVSILPGFFVLEERDFFTTFQDDIHSTLRLPYAV
jgi:hypothetical protein